jgi:hypothetical protein
MITNRRNEMIKLLKFLACASLALCLNAEAGSPANLVVNGSRCHVLSTYVKPNDCDHRIFITNLGTKTIWVDLRSDDGKDTYFGRIALKPAAEGTFEWMTNNNPGPIKLQMFRSKQSFHKGPGDNDAAVCLKGTDAHYSFRIDDKYMYCRKG